MKRYLVIEGNIGVGKTTLSNRLAEHWQVPVLLEKFMENPFLPKFYAQPERYGFSVETAFLAERYRQMHDEFASVDLRQQALVADYSFYKSLIFAGKTLKGDEYLLFKEIFGIINSKLPQPHLFVYLKASVPKLLRQIEQRGRDFEQQITADYLEQIDEAYLRFMEQASGLRCVLIETDEVDYLNNPTDFERMVELLNGHYPYGLTRITP
jgi:deoxyadenosine/deoxycytidine kinase